MMGIIVSYKGIVGSVVLLARAANEAWGGTLVMPVWQRGFLDIHHLRVGTSVCTFVVFPDGTTMLIDAGDKNYTALAPDVQSIVQPPHPNDSKTIAEWILDYVQHFWPHKKLDQEWNVDNHGDDESDKKIYKLDYALITHFHKDHMGTISEGIWPKSKSGNFLKTGITWIAEDESITIGTMIDRNYPHYNVPISDLRNYNEDMDNYLKFVQENKRGEKIQMEGFQVGSYQQIRPLATVSPSSQRKGLLCSDGQVSVPTTSTTASSKEFRCIHFMVRNIKANLNFSPALPDNQHVFAIPDTGLLVDQETGKWNENKLAIAIVMEYGNFAYYGGSDQEHRDFEGSENIDTVTPVAMAAGRVDVATLNHHGYGTNDAYFRYLDPTVMILPGWHLNHPPKAVSPILRRHKNKNTGQRRYWFSTYRHPDNEPTADDDVTWDASHGHVVVRVYPPVPLPKENGKDDRTSLPSQEQEYQVYVLNGQRDVQSVHGPFVANAKN